jgi:hypothetical protein
MPLSDTLPVKSIMSAVAVRLAVPACAAGAA